MFNTCFNPKEAQDMIDKTRKRPVLTNRCPNSKSPISKTPKSIGKHIKSIVSDRSRRLLFENEALPQRKPNRVIRGPTISIEKIPKRTQLQKPQKAKKILTQKTSTTNLATSQNMISGSSTQRDHHSQKNELKAYLKSKESTPKVPFYANINRLSTKCNSIKDMFANLQKPIMKISQQITFAKQQFIDDSPPIIKVVTPEPEQIPVQVQQQTNTNKEFLFPGFDPRRISTIFSYEDDDKSPQVMLGLIHHNLEHTERQEHPNNLKLQDSSKCKLAESNIEGGSLHYVVQESIVQTASILNNFNVVSKKPIQNGEILIVVEKNIGFLLSIKRVHKDRLTDISNEMLFYKAIGSGHSTLLSYYNTLKQHTEYLILKEYYQTALLDLSQLLDEQSLAKLIKQLLFAFQFFMNIGLQVLLTTSNIVIVNGKFKISGFRSYSKVKPNDPPLIKFYCGLLRCLIESLIEDKKVKLITNLLDDFVKTLQEGIFCPAALRLHAFLQS